MIRYYDCWEAPVTSLPKEVQEYVDNISAVKGKLLDCFALAHGTPDGEVSCVSYDVTWLSEFTVKTIKFIYDFTPEGEAFRWKSEETLHDTCSVLRWAKRIIEYNPELKEHWEWMNRVEHIA